MTDERATRPSSMPRFSGGTRPGSGGPQGRGAGEEILPRRKVPLQDPKDGGCPEGYGNAMPEGSDVTRAFRFVPPYKSIRMSPVRKNLHWTGASAYKTSRLEDGYGRRWRMFGRKYNKLLGGTGGDSMSVESSQSTRLDRSVIEVVKLTRMSPATCSA